MVSPDKRGYRPLGYQDGLVRFADLPGVDREDWTERETNIA
jgi:hypothetical protein